LGKPAAVNSLSRPLDAGLPTILSALLLACVQGARPLAHTSGNPASNLPQLLKVFFYVKRTDFFGTCGASKRDAMSADPQGEARTSRYAPNFGCPAAIFLNTD
jgi:hypothetical protein